jgi:hypothetical protein
MQRVIIATLALTWLPGCGGGNSKSQNPTAAGAQTAFADTVAFESAGTPDPQKGLSVLSLPTTLFAVQGAPKRAPAAAIAARPAAPFPGCATVGADEVVYNHCQWSASAEGTTMSGVVDGRISRDRTTHTVTFDLSLTVSGQANGQAVQLALTYKGSLTVSSSTIRGNLDIGFAGQDGSSSAGVALSFQFDLTYERDPFCITGGTMTLSERSSADTSSPSTAEVQLTWTGCQQVQICFQDASGSQCE